MLLGEKDIWEGAALIALPAAAGSGQLPRLALRRLQPRAGRASPESLDPAADMWLNSTMQASSASGGRGPVPGWPLATARSRRLCGSLQWDPSLPPNHFFFPFE